MVNSFFSSLKVFLSPFKDLFVWQNKAARNQRQHDCKLNIPRHVVHFKGPFIATQLNSTRQREHFYIHHHTHDDDGDDDDLLGATH